MPDKHRYDDLLDLPHPEPTTRPRMSMHDRAAQFAPFAALSGYHDAVDETGRYTEGFDLPDELRQAQLNEQLVLLQASLPSLSPVRITYFDPDDSKSGGQYRTVTQPVAAVDLPTQLVLLEDGTQIDFFRISEIGVPPETNCNKSHNI